MLAGQYASGQRSLSCLLITICEIPNSSWVRDTPVCVLGVHRGLSAAALRREPVCPRSSTDLN